MILQDQTKIWIASRCTQIVDGETKTYYITLRSETVNLQWMSNALEVKVFGEISDNAIEIRTDIPIALRKGDCIYMEKPKTTGVIEIDGKAYDCYPTGDYEVKTIKPSYVGGTHIKNPTVITAKKMVVQHV